MMSGEDDGGSAEEVEEIIRLGIDEGMRWAEDQPDDGWMWNEIRGFEDASDAGASWPGDPVLSSAFKPPAADTDKPHNCEESLMRHWRRNGCPRCHYCQGFLLGTRHPDGPDPTQQPTEGD